MMLFGTNDEAQFIHIGNVMESTMERAEDI